MLKKDLIIALYEPEIPQNVGAIIRTCACFDTKLVLIEPFGFVMQDKHLKRSKMDYNTDIEIHSSYHDTFTKYKHLRKVLFTPHTSCSLLDFQFNDGDLLLFGRENGIETEIAEQCDALISIPMSSRCRSLNLAMSVSIALFYAMH